MRIGWSEAKQQHFIGWVAKLAMMVVSAPATISIAKRAYPELSGWSQYLVIGACVVLVEFAFLWMYLKVENHKANANSKDESIQYGYVGGVWFMYFVLLIAGLLHGEGILAILFRASMGLLVFIATRDQLLITKARLAEQFAAGDYTNKKVLAKQRKADEEVALRRISKDRELRLSLIDKDGDGFLSKLARQNVFAMLTKQEQGIPKSYVTKVAEGPMENDFYSVAPVDGQNYKMSCKKCNESAIRPNRTSAVRTGNAHSKAHKHSTNGHRKVKISI